MKAKVNGHGILDVLKTHGFLKNYESWGVLYRLGNLKEDPKIPKPGPVIKGSNRPEPDKNFAKRPDVQRYHWLFISNLDKVLAIGLGALSVAIIWFGVLDRLAYNDAIVGDEPRTYFLCGVAAFCLLFLALGLILVVLHRLFCARAPRPDGWRGWVIRFYTKSLVVLFLLLILWSVPVHFVFDHSFEHVAQAVGLVVGWTPERVVYGLIKVILLGTVLLPLWLLWYGDRLSLRMQKEADDAIKNLKDGVAEIVGTVGIG